VGGRLAARVGLLACLVLAAAGPGAARGGGFITVPPIWKPADALVAPPWIGAKRTCELLAQNGAGPGSGAAGQSQAIANLKLAGLGLEKLDCEALAVTLKSADLTQRAAVDRLKELVTTAAASITRLRTHCGGLPGETACTALAVSPPSVFDGDERIAGLSDDEEDRDLDGATRADAGEERGAADASSAEARFVEGLTNFVLDRAKLEAIAYFEERFHASLCEPDPEAERVSYFPAVCDVLANARAAGFSLASASREMRAAARRDLRALPDNALYQQYVRKLPDDLGAREAAERKQALYAVSRVWLALAARLRANTLSPREVFGAIASVNPDVCERADARVVADCRNRFRALALVGALLDLGMRVADEAGIDKATLVDALLRYGAGHMADGAADGAQQAAYAGKLIDALAALQGIRAQVRTLADRAKEMEKAMSEARDAAGAEREAQLRRTAVLLTRFADSVVDITETSALALRGCTAKACGLGGDDVRRAIVESTQTIRSYSRLARDVMENRWTVVAVEISQLYLREGAGRGATFAGQYSPVIAELGGAQSSAEVQKILTEAAAPAGSYREKFRGNTRSITAFVGFGAGREYYSTADSSGSWPAHGLFAPLGIHVTTPVKRTRIFGGAVGVYLSILDLGPYAYYRESSSDVEKQPNVGLKQLVSPGAYLTYNISWGSKPGTTLYDWFNKSPWVIGIGVARTPSLLRTTADASVNSTRVQVFVAIDVTLFPF